MDRTQPGRTPPRARQGGQALTELALLSLVLIIVMLGAVDFARVFQFDTALQEAAREGARHGAWYDGNKGSNPYLTNADIESAVDFSLTGAGLLGPGQSSVAATSCPAAGGAAPADSSHINIYVCIDGTTPAGVTCTSADGGHDLEVAVKMLFGLVVQTSIAGFDPNFPISGDAHMRVQGC